MNRPHDSAHTHVQGKSEFVDDRPFVRGELLVGVFYSPLAHAKIKKINLDKAIKVPGVVAVFTAADLAHNKWGTIFQDQPVLAENEVNFVGEPIVLVAAEDARALREGLRLVQVEFTELPAILSVDSAKQQKSFIGVERKIERGSVDENLQKAANKIEGHLVIRGADHFYLESQAVVVYPKEDNQLEVHSSSQHPTEVQHVVSHALGLSSKDVTSIVKRMGGAFGGKESQAAPFAAMAALVAHKLKRPARLILTKDDDMIMTGKRNPFENIYRVGFDNDGRILALDAQLFSDGGAYADLSTAIMERALLHIDNAYFIPHIRVTGLVCRTNYHPHTAFRGFGGPKGVATIERIIEEIAHVLDKDPLDIRKLNCYADEKQRNITPYGQVVENNCLPQLFSQLEKDCDYRARRKEIEAHNQKALNGEVDYLRGLSLTAVKFGISFTTRFLNQGNALVLIHKDGTLQVSTGATEMGQGVNSRIAEIVAEELGLPREAVRVMATTTDKNANTSPTAASSGTDLNGTAAWMAVRKIKLRLSELAHQLLQKPETHWAKHKAALGTEQEIEVGGGAEHDIIFAKGAVYSKANPEKKIAFQELVNEAFLNRISLSDYAHYKVPDLDFNKLTGQGRAFLYFTQGVAASEVKIDLLTGEVKILRADILMDLGRPINEALDMGQVSGGFVQGLGWMTTENLFYSEGGKLLSHSPSTYKIPNIQDIPRTFNAKLINNNGNTKNIKGTKAVGEPPLLLCISAWTAIQNALTCMESYRKNYPRMAIPATQEVVLRALRPEQFAKWDGLT